jgi:hypothetical protein
MQNATKDAVARTSSADLVDRLLGGKLEEKLAAWQAEGLSLHAISIRLHEEHEITVTPSTVSRWIRRFEEQVA